MRYLRRLIVGIIIFMLACVGIEGFFRTLPRQPYTASELRVASAPAYQNAPYDVTQTLAETRDITYFTPEGKSYLLPQNYAGKWVSIVDNKRFTVGNPSDAQNTIYVFGSSTVFSGEVPDAYTIPSVLQSLEGTRYRVLNMGLTSMRTTQMLDYLYATPIQPNDIVIWYDGVNEISQGFYTNNAVGGIRDVAYDPLTSLRFDIWQRFGSKSQFVNLWVYPFTDNMPLHLQNPTTRQTVLDAVTAQFEQSIRDGNRYVNEQDATFIHILQPTLLMSASLSPTEQILLANRYVFPLGYVFAFQNGYPSLITATTRLADEGITSVSFGNVLDNLRASGASVYIDANHVNHLANAEIAQHIADLLNTTVLHR